MTDTELELPQGWAISSINQVCKTSSGGTPSRGKPEYYGGSIPWIKSGELKELMIYDSDEKITKIGLENSSAKIFPKGTVLLALYGANIGNTGLLQIDSATNQAVCAIFNDKDILDTNYLLWYIRFIKKNLVKQAIGGAQPNISQTIVNKLEIPISPLNEQKRIVSKIEELFSKIDSAKQSLGHTKLQLEQYRQSLLKFAFEGKLTEKWREQNKDNMKETQNNNPLPKGWIVCKLEDVAMAINSGFASGKHNTSKKGIPHIRPMNIDSSGNIDLSLVKYVEDNFKDKLQKNDVLFNNTNSPKLLGKTALIKENANWGYSNHMTRIRFDISKVEPSWFAIFLHKLFLDGYYRQIAKNHVNQSSVNSNDLATKISIIVAPRNEQKQVVAQIEQGFSHIENTQQIVNSTLEKLDIMKMSILKQAFEGKLSPQDPHDEPAEILLEKIKQEKTSKK